MKTFNLVNYAGISLIKVNIVNEMGEEQIIWSCDAFVKKRGGTIVKKVATSVGYVVTRGKIFYLAISCYWTMLAL